MKRCVQTFAGRVFIFLIFISSQFLFFSRSRRCNSSTWMFSNLVVNLPSAHLQGKEAAECGDKRSIYFAQRLPLIDHISRSCAVDHQGAGADVPPKERLPIMCGAEGPILRLVCPRGQVRIAHTHAHTHSPMHASSDRVTQTPTRAIPSAEHSRVFVQRFTADTFSSRRCLYSISCCPRCREELKLFVSPMQRRQPVQFGLISLYLSGSWG